MLLLIILDQTHTSLDLVLVLVVPNRIKTCKLTCLAQSIRIKAGSKSK